MTLSPTDDQRFSGTPEEFEAAVMGVMRKAAGGVEGLQLENREVIEADDGSYEIDLTLRFTAFGAGFLVLVECKAHSYPIKRDYVILLESKRASIGAHKGILAATVGFQSGALAYAKKHGIALLRVADGHHFYVTKARYSPHNPRRGLPPAVIHYRMEDETRVSGTLLSLISEQEIRDTLQL